MEEKLETIIFHIMRVHDGADSSRLDMWGYI